MPWRALVLALLLLRLGLHAALWLALALGPGLGVRQRLSTAPSSLAPPSAPSSLAPASPPLAPSPLAPSPLGPSSGSARWGTVPGRDDYARRFSGPFPPQLRARLRDRARGMFVFGYDSYMAHAFPQDELNPIHCCGRGPDRGDP